MNYFILLSILFTSQICYSQVGNKDSIINVKSIDKIIIKDSMIKNIDKILIKNFGKPSVLPTYDRNQDLSLKVLFKYKTDSENKVAYYLNDKFIHQDVLLTIDINIIDDLKIESGLVKIDSIEYYGKILIKTKKNYNPKLISLIKLKEKYFNEIEKPIIYSIDGALITTNYNEAIFDEDFILQIHIENLNIISLKHDYILAKIFTKTQKNIDDLTGIKIR
jgi:hypothetical protein